jgi:hypothetical protein
MGVVGGELVCAAMSCCSSCSRIWTSWVKRVMSEAFEEVAVVCAETTSGDASSAMPSAIEANFLGMKVDV